MRSVAIFGDYDVDGASSSALLRRFLAWHGLEARIYIPDRITEGYGPNKAAIASLIEDGAQLIVTVDCGSTSFDALEVAAKRGVDVIVADHHQVGENLPAAYAIVNPNRQDCLSGQGHLCAAGVVFLMCVAMQRHLAGQRRLCEAKSAGPAGVARHRRLGDCLRRGAAYRRQPRFRRARAEGAAQSPKSRPQGALRRCRA